jgi:hypothetical protein
MSLVDPYARRSDLKLLLRSVQPSASSLAACVVGGITLVGVHLLFLTLSQPPFPYSADDPVVQAYNAYISAPIGNLLHSNMLNTFLVVLLWAIPAWLVFELAAHVAGSVSTWQSSKRNITLPQGSEGLATASPLQRSFLNRLLWQGAVLVIGIALSAAFVPIIHFILLNNERMVHTLSTSHAARAVGVSLLLWSLILHIYVVLLRWYMARTRVFGEILY